MIAQDANRQFPDQVQTFARIGAVTDHIAQAIHVGDALLSDIVQHDAQRFQIAVDVANQRTFHRVEPRSESIY